MADMTSQTSESATPKFSAPKDKNCPYCGQAFTSSSLGRHLDLYIKEKNPKPPDGIHDIDAIKKLRGGITRRQPRGSIGGRQDSTPTGTPRPAAKHDTPATTDDPETTGTAVIPKDGTYAVDSTLSKFPFLPRWEATGVINDIPTKGPWEAEASGHEHASAAKKSSTHRNVSKQAMQKAHFDAKQKLADAMDTARAAELALREILGSWRSAKQHVDNSSMPFDFDPLSLDFPALTLQCLHPPPTLFSSTQHATSTSWSVQSPGKREFGALQAYFLEEFDRWKVTCRSATTSANEELTYPPSSNPTRNSREAVLKAEKAAANLEKQVDEHLHSAFAVWESLPIQRQQELWVLELARGVGRKHKESETMKAAQHQLKQENTNLKMQIDQLNRLQQPREFKLLSPTTFPIAREIVSHAYEQGVKGGKSIGFDLEDRHVDISLVVTKSIERWKNVITSTRVSTSGMSAQRPLDQAAAGQAHNLNSPTGSQTYGISSTVQPDGQRHQRLSNASTHGPVSEHTEASTSTTAPPSVDDVSDQDADAEMEDDDAFHIMNSSPMKQTQPPMQQTPTLDVPRTRGALAHQQQQQQQQQQVSTPDMHYMMQNGTGSPVSRSAMTMSRSMPNMNMSMHSGHMQGGDMGMMPQVSGDNMYIEQ